MAGLHLRHSTAVVVGLRLMLRVRRGLYAVVPSGGSVGDFRADPFLVASKLAEDGVLAYRAALQFRGKTYSVWHRFTVLSARHLRPLTFQGNEFVAVVPPKAVRNAPDFGGLVVTEPYGGGGEVRVTTLERTLVDLLDAPAQGGGWEEVWRSLEMVEFFDLHAFVSYALKLGTSLTAARVGFFLVPSCAGVPRTRSPRPQPPRASPAPALLPL